MALVMATASQEEEEEHRKEATEIEGNDLPMAAENVDSDAEKQAEDTPSFKNVDESYNLLVSANLCVCLFVSGYPGFC